MKLLYILIILGVQFVFIPTIDAQLLSYDDKVQVILSDNVPITLYKEFNGADYYYLPPDQSLKLSLKDDGTPQFLFMKYTSEKSDLDGGVSGAILHFLMEWSLTSAQFAELNELVQNQFGGEVKGPVDLKPTPQSFQIISAILNDDGGFSSTFSHTGHAPVIEGGKIAVAAKLDKNGAQLLAATFEESRSITDISLNLNYDYDLLIRAAEGKLIYHWDRIESQSEGLAVDYLRKELDNQPEKFDQALKNYKKNRRKQDCKMNQAMDDLLVAGKTADQIIGNTSGGGSGGTYEYYVGESVMRSIYEFMSEKEYVELTWQENINDERVAVFREAFFDYFLNSFADLEYPEEFSSDRLTINQPENNIKNNAEGSYTFKGCSTFESKKSRSKVILLKDLILPISRPHNMVNNLAATYDQVKHNKKCVAEIILDGRFYQHRDINFILDIEAKEMFDKEVNYVTINVKKKRSSGNDYSDEITVGSDYIRNNGTLAKITYSKGLDKNPDVYLYKMQWSLKGGNLYPEKPKWKKGDWQGVTLAPPVVPRVIEFEADLDELKSNNIVRATLQVRYLKFGVEHEENIPIRVSKKQAFVDRTIYTDRTSPGYAYRLILTHKEKGKLAFDWDSKLNDNYVFASIPNDFMEDELLVDQLIDAGLKIIKADEDGKISSGDTILEKFKDIIISITD